MDERGRCPQHHRSAVHGGTDEVGGLWVAAVSGFVLALLAAHSSVTALLFVMTARHAPPALLPAIGYRSRWNARGAADSADGGHLPRSDVRAWPAARTAADDTNSSVLRRHGCTDVSTTTLSLVEDVDRKSSRTYRASLLLRWGPPCEPSVVWL
jgi:hypothetical protein